MSENLLIKDEKIKKMMRQLGLHIENYNEVCSILDKLSEKEAKILDKILTDLIIGAIEDHVSIKNALQVEYYEYYNKYINNNPEKDDVIMNYLSTKYVMPEEAIEMLISDEYNHDNHLNHDYE